MIVSWIGSVVVHASVGVVSVRKDRIELINHIALISGCVFFVSHMTWE